jgi:hypothetical protein
MAVSKFADKLNGMKNSWDDSKNQYDSMFGGVKIPADTYLAQMQSVKLKESKSSGKLMIQREHVIIEGQFKGTVVYDNMQIETPMGMTFIRRWFEQMGYEAPADPAEIEDVIRAIAEDAALVKIQVKHSGDYVNVSVIEVVETSSANAPSASREEPKAEEPKAEEPKAEKPKTSSGKTKEKANDSEDAEIIKGLHDFCKAQDIETEEDDTLDVLKERVKEYKWPVEEMTEEEIELFTNAGIADAIKQKETKKKQKANA